MEKIKKALERAQQERTIASPQPHRAVHSAPEPLTDSKITYTKTRNIEVSKETLREMRVIASNDSNPISDAYNVLRTHVHQRLKANESNTLAITSPTTGNGKTLTAINLAISLAREVNYSVLLVDMDLRSPNIHNYFFSEEQPGISDYLTEDIELSEILFNPGIERLVILPGNKPFTNSSEMLSSPRMVQLVDELKTRYPSRIVIYDMPPLLVCDDMLAFSPYIDATMLVVEEGRTRKDELRRAYELLENTNIIGTLLNKSEEKGSAYGYY